MEARKARRPCRPAAIACDVAVMTRARVVVPPSTTVALPSASTTQPIDNAKAPLLRTTLA